MSENYPVRMFGGEQSPKSLVSSLDLLTFLPFFFSSPFLTPCFCSAQIPDLYEELNVGSHGLVWDLQVLRKGGH